MIHTELDVWKQGISFVTNIYELTKSFPSNEQFGLVSQIRRAAVSVPANIAEGAARNHKNEFKQFLYIARGSAAELDTLLIIACNLGFIEKNHKIISDLQQIRKMLTVLIKKNDQ